MRIWFRVICMFGPPQAALGRMSGLFKDQLALRALQAHRVSRGRKANKDLLVLLALKVAQAPQAKRVRLVILVQ